MDALISSFLVGEPKSSRPPPAAPPLPKDLKRVFVTLLTSSDFGPGAATLAKSLRKRNTAHAFYVMVTEDVSKTIVKQLERLSDGILMVSKIASPYGDSTAAAGAADEAADGKSGAGTAKKAPSWLGSEMTKLNLWSLTQFDKLVYIDADCLVMENIESLFDRETDFGLCAAPDVFPPDKFNAGVMVVKPDVLVYQSMLDALPRLPSYDGGDTGFLNAFFPTWYSSGPASRLSFGFNAQRTLYWMTYKERPGYWESISPLSIIHYSSSPKPWEQKDKKGDLEMLWWMESMA